MSDPISVYYTPVVTAASLTIYTYQTGAFLSIFSGSYISDVSGSTISDVGIASEDKSDQYVFDMTMNNNTYNLSRADLAYAIIVRDYYQTIPLLAYSASSLSNMSASSLTNLSVVFIG